MKQKLIALLIAAGAAAFTQQTSATLLGTATDPAGAVTPNVKIVATHQQSNTVHASQTDGSGNYSLPFLPPGEYTIAASSKGFQTIRAEKVMLQVGQTGRVDFRLRLGEVSDQVTVESNAVMLQTENSAVGAVITGKQIVDLPLNGRNFVQLAQLVPGVQPGTPGSITVRRGRGSLGESSSATGATGMSANGARDTTNRFFLDGAEFMDYDSFGYPFSPSVDSLAEFKVETSTTSSEFGGAPGGQVSLVTKRGSNAFHGTLWEFNRNDALTQSYDAIANTTVAPPRLNRNQYGANVGGPLSIPKVYKGKDRTFFFFNWESGRQVQSAVQSPRLVPAAAFRDGDFRGLTNSRDGSPIVLRDPLGVGIVGNVIPKTALSPQALTLLKFTPTANSQQGAFNYDPPRLSANTKQDNYTARGDHNFSARDMLTARYVINDLSVPGLPIWGNDQRDGLARVQNFAATYSHTFSPSKINEVRVGWSDINDAESFGTTGKSEFDIANQMKIPLASQRPRDFGPPQVSISGLDGGYSVFGLQRTIGPVARINAIHQVTDIYSMQAGRHFLKIGGEIFKRNVQFEQARDPRGTFTFDGTYTGSSLADYMLGYVKVASINPTATSTDITNLSQSYFIQDDWKIRPGLTINAGLRYDYFAPYVQKDDEMINIEQNGFFVTNLVTPKTSRYGRGMLRPDRNNVGPRIGFAWQPGFVKDTVVRGAYGVYYFPIVQNAPFNMAENYKATAGGEVRGNLTGSPNVFFNNPFAQLTLGPATFNNANSLDQDLRDAYMQQWNLTIQRRFRAATTLDVGYVGSKGNKLPVDIGDLNRPIDVVDPRVAGLPSLADRRPNQLYRRAVDSNKSIGNSIYHALQVKAEHRGGRGLTLMASYTYSKCISGPRDIGGFIGGGSFIGSPQDIFNLAGERSLCGFDVTQRFVTSAVYELPFFKSATGASKYILAGWQFAVIAPFQSGFPGPIGDNLDTTGTGVISRPDMVAGQTGNLPAGDRTWLRWFNTGAFARAPYGRFGNSSRTGAVRLPGMANFDFSMNKMIKFSEVRRVEFRAEIFNVNNHFNPAPGDVDRTITSRTFGAVGGGVRGVTTRVIQLGGKFSF